MLLACALAFVACGEGKPSEPPKTEAPTATAAALVAKLKVFAGRTIWTIEHFSDGIDAKEVGGLQLDVNGETDVSVRMFDREKQPLAGPFALRFEPTRNAFIASQPMLLGKVGHELSVSLDDSVPDELQVLFYRARPTPKYLLPSAITKRSEDRRNAFAQQVERYRDVPGLTGLDRLADILQVIADTDYETFMIRNPPPQATFWTGAPTLVHVILEDALDILAPGMADLKLAVMVLHPHEPHVRAPQAIPQTGMKPVLNIPGSAQGAGRGRHLIFNAIASLNAPDFIVSFVAKAQGHDFEPPLKPLVGEDLADVTTNEIGRRFGAFLEELAKEGKLGDGHSVRDWIRAEMGDGSPGPDLEAVRVAALNFPSGEVQLTVDVSTKQAYATAQLWVPKDDAERQYIKEYLDSVLNDMIQPDLAPGTCAEHKAYPQPPLRPLRGFVSTGPLLVTHGATPFFSLNREDEGRYQSPYAALMLPTPPLLDFEMKPASSLADAVPGLEVLGVRVPDVSADYLNFDPKAPYPLSFSLGAGTMMARLSGSKVIECKATAAAPNVTVSVENLAKFAGGSILFRHIRHETETANFLTPPRTIQFRSQTTRGLTLTPIK